MISALVGEVVDGSDHGVLVQSGTVLFELMCSHRDSEYLLQSVGQGARTIYTQLEIDESSIVLIGFHTPEAQTLYRALLKISGIGRKSALAVLNGGEPRDVIRAVMEKDTKFIAALPKLGPKKALDLINHLNKQWTGAPPRKLPVPLHEWIAARDVLIERGLSVDDAEDRLFSELDNT